MSDGRPQMLLRGASQRGLRISFRSCHIWVGGGTGMKVPILQSCQQDSIVGAEFKREREEEVQTACGDDSLEGFCCKGGEAGE